MIERIKEFFRNLFGINNKKMLEAPKNNSFQSEILHQTSDAESQSEYNQFKEKMKITPNYEEKEKALKLKNDYKTGIIDEEDLSEEEFNILSDLYESQIEKTKQSILLYKNKIMSIKSKLVKNY